MPDPVIPSYFLRRLEDALNDLDFALIRGSRLTPVGQRRLLVVEERARRMRDAAIALDLERGIVTEFDRV